MNKLNYWDATWSLDEAQCPCDLHFLEYLEKRRSGTPPSSTSAPATTTSSA